MDTWKKPFHVFSIRRSDLQNLFSKEQIEVLTDADMKQIADKLADIHADVHYWDNLENISQIVIKDRQEKNTKNPNAQNLCAKRVEPENAYEVWQNGVITYWVLKKYQSPEKEAKNKYAKWFCASVSPFTGKQFEYGDMYVREITTGGYKVNNPLPKKEAQ